MLLLISPAQPLFKLIFAEGNENWIDFLNHVLLISTPTTSTTTIKTTRQGDTDLFNFHIQNPLSLLLTKSYDRPPLIHMLLLWLLRGLLLYKRRKFRVNLKHISSFPLLITKNDHSTGADPLSNCSSLFILRVLLYPTEWLASVWSGRSYKQPSIFEFKAPFYLTFRMMMSNNVGKHPLSFLL